MPAMLLTYRWYAKTYGWTPDQVDELPADVVIWFPAIEQAVDHVVEKRQQQAARASRAR
jgi:hypothetical protein